MLPARPTRPRPTHASGQLISIEKLLLNSVRWKTAPWSGQLLAQGQLQAPRPRVVPGIPVAPWQVPPGWEKPMNPSSSDLPSTLQNHDGAYLYPCGTLRGVEREAAAHFTDTLLIVVFQWYQPQIHPQ